MHKLLGQILNAHGGIDRWNKYEKVEATIVSGGGFFPLKGVIQDGVCAASVEQTRMAAVLRALFPNGSS
jgi:hypothetical protein